MHRMNALPQCSRQRILSSHAATVHRSGRLVLILISFIVMLCDNTILPRSASAHQREASLMATEDTLSYGTVVRLRSGSVLIGRVEYDTETDRYTVKTRDGAMQSVLRRDVLLIEDYSRTLLPPTYNVMQTIYPCDERQREHASFFLELRIWAMYTGKDESISQIGLNEFTLGGEAAGGMKLSKRFALGIGASYFLSRSIDRIPLFAHARYQLALECFAPFLYAQAGTVFDSQSGDYISLNKIFHPGPKIAGVGIGIDYPLSHAIDISGDVGYRYLQLPTKVPCDCGDASPGATAIYYNESHGVLLRIGVTW